MKYFIGFSIEGEVAVWDTNLVKELSERCNTWKLHEKIPPHITVFSTFETDEITPIKALLGEWAAAQQSTGKILLNNYGRFDDRVVYVSVVPDTVSTSAVLGLREMLEALPGMPQAEFPVWHPHLTVMNKVTPEAIEAAWVYVSTLEKPNFTLSFNSVTLFSLAGDDMWVKNESFMFGRKN